MPCFADENIAKVDTYLQKLFESGPAKVTAYADKANAQSIDLNEELKTDFEPGLAYGATVTKVVPIPYPKIKSLMDSLGGLFKIVSAVTTQHNFKQIDQKPRELILSLEIKVPVVADFVTTDTLTAYEKLGFGFLEWRQKGRDGDLAYNRGFLILLPDGLKTKVFVIGIHVLKPERKIAWVGRATARQFARTHYTAYVTALEDVLK